MFGETGQHLRANFFAIVEGKSHVTPANASQSAVRACLTFDLSTQPEQGRQNPLGFG
jgi:hypothetical protein